MRLRQRVTNERWLLIGRESEIEDFDIAVLDYPGRRLMRLRQAPALGDFLRTRPGARADRDDGKSGLSIGCKVAFGHDHAGAHAADLEFARADLHVRLKTSGVLHPLSSPRGRHEPPADARPSASPH